MYAVGLPIGHSASALPSRPRRCGVSGGTEFCREDNRVRWSLHTVVRAYGLRSKLRNASCDHFHGKKSISRPTYCQPRINRASTAHQPRISRASAAHQPQQRRRASIEPPLPCRSRRPHDQHRSRVSTLRRFDAPALRLTVLLRAEHLVLVSHVKPHPLPLRNALQVLPLPPPTARSAPPSRR